MSTTIDLKIEFSGGLELLFGNQRTHALSLPAVVPSTVSESGSTDSTRSTDVTYLMHHLRTHVLKERPELFMEGDTVYVYSHPYHSHYHSHVLISLTRPHIRTHARSKKKKVDQVFLSSSMIRIGSWKARGRMCSKVVMRSCSSRRCMVGR